MSKGSGLEMFDIGSFRSGLVTWGQETVEGYFDELEELATPAADNMRDILRAATTPTGDKRAAAGGLPGRIEGGNMINAIRSEVSRTKNSLTLRWGWVRDFKPYYAFQEGGKAVFNVGFEGMGALWGSFVNTQDKFYNILKRRR